MNANKVLVLKDNNNVFIVRLVERGDSYGKNFCLINISPDDYVEFYDLFSEDSDFGYLIGRYYKQTIMQRKGGLLLCSGDPGYQISDEAMEKVRKWLTE